MRLLVAALRYFWSLFLDAGCDLRSLPVDMVKTLVTILGVKSTGEPDREEADRDIDRPPPHSSPDSKPSNWMKHAGLGIELAGTTIGVGLIGYAIDWKMQNVTPYATALAAMVGFSFAMFRFIQNVTRENR